MLFASLCYHLEFLEDTLHRKSKLQASLFFNCIPTHIKSLAVVKYPWNATKYTPVFTGLPPHVTLLSKMEGLKQDFHKMKDELIQEFKVELDKHVNNGEKYFDSKALIDKLDLLEKNIMDQLKKGNTF